MPIEDVAGAVKELIVEGYNPKSDEIFDFQPDGAPVAVPDPRKARLDVIELAFKAAKPR